MGVFPKGLVHGFGLKVSIFPFFCFREKRKENVFHGILERKKSFYAKKKKKKKFKKSKNYNFSIEVSPWFWPKIVKFSSFFSRQNRPGKCVSRYCRKKKRLLQTIKTRSLKSRKLVFFWQRG